MKKCLILINIIIDMMNACLFSQYLLIEDTTKKCFVISNVLEKNKHKKKRIFHFEVQQN